MKGALVFSAIAVNAVNAWPSSSWGNTTTHASASQGASTTTASVTSWTTSTVCTTQTHTITECPTEVPNCPNGHVKTITETIPLYITVCPVTSEKPPVTSQKPVTTPKPSATHPLPRHGSNSTSTLYTTHTYTIQSCPPSVPNCSVGKVTTTIYATATTCFQTLASQKPSQPPHPPASKQPPSSKRPHVPQPLASSQPEKQPPSPTVVPPPAATTGSVVVTAAAGHVAGSLSLIAAVAGLVALLYIS